MIPAEVRYRRADSLEDALAALGEEDAKALAGGQSLLPVMKLRIARPSLLVDISGLDLGGVKAADDEVRIGALTTWVELEEAPVLDEPGLAAIAECARGIGDLQVRNLGTIGGSLVHADPSSDMPAVLLALGARAVVRSTQGEREIAVDELLVGPFSTTLGPQELVTEVVVPRPPAGSGSAYEALEHPASGFALAGAAALAGPAGETVALTGVGARPFVMSDRFEDVDVLDDRFASAEYRREIASVLVARALTRARERAEAA